MPDRRIDKERLSPEDLAIKKFSEIQFREEDTPEYRAAVLMAIAKQIISTRGQIDVSKNGSNVPEKKSEHELSPEQKEKLISAIKDRFENPPRHYSKQFVEWKQKTTWEEIEKQLLMADEETLWTLNMMENSGGEVDCIVVDQQNFYFADCSAESPAGRREMSYNNAEAQAKLFGIDICSGSNYNTLQKLLTMDANTSSWVKTDEVTKTSGFALFKNRNSGDHIDKCPCNQVSKFKGWRGIVKIKKFK